MNDAPSEPTVSELPVPLGVEGEDQTSPILDVVIDLLETEGYEGVQLR